MFHLPERGTIPSPIIPRETCAASAGRYLLRVGGLEIQPSLQGELMSAKSVSIQILVLSVIIAAGCETKPATPPAAAGGAPKGLPAVAIPADNP